jgi:hypothetical protein
MCFEPKFALGIAADNPQRSCAQHSEDLQRIARPAGERPTNSGHKRKKLIRFFLSGFNGAQLIQSFFEECAMNACVKFKTNEQRYGNKIDP